MEWFIQIQRKILDWEWYSDINTKVVFLHLLFTCNFKEAKWRWKIVKPWQKITSLSHLANETCLSVQQVRTAIEKLKSTWEITHESTSDYTMLTLNNWDIYNKQDNKRITNEQQTNNKRITTIEESNKNNNDNNENNTEIVATQPNEYQESILYLKRQTLENIDIPEFAEDYTNDWIAFIAYWTEKGRTWKLRAEWEKTFEIRRRWATWMSRKKEKYEVRETRIPRWISV